jgi:hypothetical protein
VTIAVFPVNRFVWFIDIPFPMQVADEIYLDT